MSLDPFTADWPSSPVPRTIEWKERCVARLVRNDPVLDATDADLLARDMAMQRHWRLQEPEDAADALFSPIRPRP